MPETINVDISQLPLEDQIKSPMRWHVDEHHITFYRLQREIRVEVEPDDLDECDDDWDCLPEEEALEVLEKTKVGWLGLDGFVTLRDYIRDPTDPEKLFGYKFVGAD